ncbi:MAG: hypothetical protein PHT31_00595 [Candidatus Omnitrophica bacterium]|nr:hypothetical protein [Candidatus Omnitrophota bacterium]MDD5652642.1 hypothetical protein [Candidatus Omnitrophota bacterium]
MKKHLFPALIFIILIFIMTFPLVLNINKSIPGFFSTDESYGALWDSWRIKFSFLNHLSFTHVSLIAYPFGVDYYQSGFISYLWVGIIYLLSILTNPAISFNIQVLLNFFFNAFLTYLLVIYLTKNKLSGIFSAIIFAFCPYQFARVWQHLGLSYNELIVLSLFALILLREKVDRKNSVIFFISIILLLSFDFSILLFGIFTLSVFVIYSLLYHFLHKKMGQGPLRFIKRAGLVTLLAICILSFQYLPLFLKVMKFSGHGQVSAHNLYNRPFADLFEESARPLSYLLPAVAHPLFGGFTEHFLGSQLYGISLTEHALYLGWVALIFAFFALKKRRSRPGENAEGFFIGFFFFLAIIAWFFSQPPWWKIGSLRIYMPSFFIYKILPMYRAYCRFGIVVELAVAVLAGFGLKFILENKTAAKRIFLTVVFSVLVLFEFWNYPPFKVIDVSRAPAVYYWLKDTPSDTVVAEYPLYLNSPNEMYRFYQIFHQKRIINFIVPGTQANKAAQAITKLSDLKTAKILKQMGVKYCLVHEDNYLDTEFIGDKKELEAIGKNPGLRFIRSFSEEKCPGNEAVCTQASGKIDVYEVIAERKADEEGK